MTRFCLPRVQPCSPRRTSCSARPLSSAGIAPLPRYYGPICQPSGHGGRSSSCFTSPTHHLRARGPSPVSPPIHLPACHALRPRQRLRRSRHNPRLLVPSRIRTPILRHVLEELAALSPRMLRASRIEVDCRSTVVPLPNCECADIQIEPVSGRLGDRTGVREVWAYVPKPTRVLFTYKNEELVFG